MMTYQEYVENVENLGTLDREDPRSLDDNDEPDPEMGSEFESPITFLVRETRAWWHRAWEDKMADVVFWITFIGMATAVLTAMYIWR